jgi:hypothetical protein
MLIVYHILQLFSTKSKTLPFDTNILHEYSLYMTLETLSQKQNRLDAGHGLEWLVQTLKTKHRWYTGLEVKTYIANTFFSLFENKRVNQNIASGRWSGYYHLSLEAAFTNLLHKHAINKNSVVLVNEILPKNISHILKDTGCTIHTCPLDINTLSFDTSKLQTMLEAYNINLVIAYCANGMYNCYIDSLEKANAKTIPTLFIADHHTISPDYITLLEKHTLGSMMIQSNRDFAYETFSHLAPEISIPAQSITYFSWYFETRTQSVPEYHLAESKSVYENVLESLSLLFLQQIQSKSFIKGIYWRFQVKKMLGAKKLHTPLIEKIQETYTQTLTHAVPDFVFSYLAQNIPSSMIHTSRKEVFDLDHYMQEQGNALQLYLQNTAKNGNITQTHLPSLQNYSTFYVYTFYTDDIDFWTQVLDSHSFEYTKKQPSTPSQRFIYAISIDLLENISAPKTL